MAKILVNQTTQVELEVEFPVYKKVNECLIVRFDNEKCTGIKISNYPVEFCGCEISIGNQPKEWLNAPPATKKEFLAMFKEVQSKINSLI